ncbi:MAG: hypothetical protein KDI15_08825 [Thiothrix sp.]|nr:hypothetical protein [Thiothrix sp.]HPE58757.1 hypothetical protein [Thiolinea sp.]
MESVIPKDRAGYRLLNNRYVLTKCLFSGPVGQIHLARVVRAADRSINTEVLVHSIPPGVLDDTRLASRCRMLRQQGGRLEEQGLLPVLDCGWLEGCACFVLQKPRAWSFSLLNGRDHAGSRLHQQALLIGKRLHEQNLIPVADLHPNWFLVTAEGELRVPGTVLLSELTALAGEVLPEPRPRSPPLLRHLHGVSLLVLLASLGAMAMVVGWVLYRFDGRLGPLLLPAPPSARVADPPLDSRRRVPAAQASHDTDASDVADSRLSVGQFGSAFLRDRMLPVREEFDPMPESAHSLDPLSAAPQLQGSVPADRTGATAVPELAGVALEDQDKVPVRPAVVEKPSATVAGAGVPVRPPVVMPSRSSEPAKPEAPPESAAAPSQEVAPVATAAAKPAGDADRLKAAGMNRDQLIRRANAAIRQGQLGEYPGQGAIYFIRLLRRIDPSNRQVRYLARNVATGHHDQARNQIHTGARKSAAHSLWMAHRVIQEFNLMPLNPVQALLEHRLTEMADE